MRTGTTSWPGFVQANMIWGSSDVGDGKQRKLGVYSPGHWSWLWTILVECQLGRSGIRTWNYFFRKLGVSPSSLVVVPLSMKRGFLKKYKDGVLSPNPLASSSTLKKASSNLPSDPLVQASQSKYQREAINWNWYQKENWMIHLVRNFRPRVRSRWLEAFFSDNSK